MNPLHIQCSGWRWLDFFLPILSEVIGKVLRKGFNPIQLFLPHRTNDWMPCELVDLFFHRLIDEIEIGNEFAVAGLINNTLEEAAHKTGVFGHRVGLFRAFPELSSKCDGHERYRDHQFQDPIRSFGAVVTSVAKGYGSSRL